MKHYTIPRSVYASILVAIGAVFLYLTGTSAWNAFDSRSWPTAEATVVSSAVQVTNEEGSRRDGRRARSGRSDRSKKNYLEVTYIYVVDGTQYVGDGTNFGGFSKSEANAQNLARQFPKGARVPVHFKRSDPALSVLLPGVLGPDIFLGFAIAAILFVVAGVVWWWRELEGLFVARIQRVSKPIAK